MFSESLVHMNTFKTFLLSTVLLFTACADGMAQDKGKAKMYHFKEPQLFHPHPHAGTTAKEPWNLKNLGTVGIGIDLTGPQLMMVISNVEPGSPADKTKKLKKGQIIESINGQVPKDVDPRIILGNIVTEAEASDGRVRIKVKEGDEVVVQIPIMGGYSPTWPVNCKKSDLIVRQLADKLATLDKPGWGAPLFLLSTGEEKDLKVVKRWMKDLGEVGSFQWQYGYKGIGVCEYFLRTGDAGVLPAIRSMVKDLEKTMYTGGWSGRGKPAEFTYSTGSGQLHAAGVHCLTALLMARMCGVEVDESTLQEVLTQFYRFAGRGNLAYGNGLPENGFTDNGKTSGLAVAMAAAALLTPEGEASNYAKARDNSAMKAFYATNWFHAAHTGGGLGEIWHHAAMGMMKDKRPAQYRSYMDTRRWVMDLSRRHDGTIGIAGMTDRYDASATDGDIDWGTYFALTYTLPRKQLQLFGAPRSKWVQHHPLPKRPWGTEEDDQFLSTDPVQQENFPASMLLEETVEKHSSYAVMNRVNPPSVEEAELIHYLHHPEFGLRDVAMRSVINQQRYHFVVPCLQSEDARLRHVGLIAISGIFKGSALPPEKLTSQIFDLIGQMIDNPNESWWVLQEAIEAIRRAPKAQIVKHKARLLQLLKFECVWIRTAAAVTLSQIATEPDQYKEVLPKVIDALATINVDSASYSTSAALKSVLTNASLPVKQFAYPLLRESYLDISPELKGLNGVVMTKAADTVRERMRHSLVLVPGGADFALRLPKATLTSTRSGDAKDQFVYDKFEKREEFIGKWLYLSKVWGHPVKDQDLAKSTVRYLTKQRELKAKGTTGKNRYRPEYLTLNDKGAGSRQWTGNRIIVLERNEAVTMEVRNINGRRFLLVELGEFPQKAPNEWHCSYNLYVLESDFNRK